MTPTAEKGAKMKSTKKFSIEKVVLAAILTALVIVLQFLGSFIRFGPFSISLVLIPIVIGAATCGTRISTWLGFAFSVVVLMTDAAAFLAISIPGTIVTVLLKGTAAGLVAGLVYRLVEKFNRYVAVIVAAVICPIVNTGIFVLGCFTFFFAEIESWGLAGGFAGGIEYIFIGMIGLNFLVELATNVILSPVAVRIISIKKK